MKPQMALKPMVFALAALMAAAAQAGGWHPTPQPTGTVAAVVTDVQKSEHNKFDDTNTENNASADNSVNSNSGNVGVNAQSGSGNQADNAGAISSAKGDFATVFAVIDVDQGSSHNNFVNKGTQNNASLDGSITGNSGNVGYNGQAGQGNQGKNNLAITTADGKNIAAASNTEQNSLNNSYLNTAASSHGYGKPQYVSNNASLDNSVNRNSGNVGVNLQSGAGNQGSNSLSIGQGCSVCASGVRF
ncbi:MAG: hypothetical protein A2W79_19580 [Pseudomonadales bacterium RIFCSPLOWO2_12_60_38]|uniref:Heme utilization protein n=4 Tax=Pseudomonas TaxID=286 RepID=A0A0R3C0L6_9PSED|nr:MULTISPECIES: hypothetical protein [Pseudomonas]AFJ55091.1 hypothetical protein PflA506_2997 [Pseudomonas fluorescens A506]ETK43545.1 hypothetical protein H098_01460 [Pseudomonas fluorescens FH5]MDN5430117.1 hypothetical protein [Pseudomonadales bacterium]OHC32225.1 MAG: hypothetical protein A2W79_19580 [Pseudomonadales bacterium RIFCSPLOWO2_12_60_38]OHC38342.1 MAG: hypothetical protein A3G72_19060 [Pseudomonadales bacterium RIFCSPLOWO2_12_FULL_59_450]PMZ68033.1 hypothetical protein C1X25_